MVRPVDTHFQHEGRDVIAASQSRGRAAAPHRLQPALLGGDSRASACGYGSEDYRKAERTDREPPRWVDRKTLLRRMRGHNPPARAGARRSTCAGYLQLARRPLSLPACSASLHSSSRHVGRVHRSAEGGRPRSVPSARCRSQEGPCPRAEPPRRSCSAPRPPPRRPQSPSAASSAATSGLPPRCLRRSSLASSARCRGS